jgi:hypothetical protein
MSKEELKLFLASEKSVYLAKLSVTLALVPFKNSVCIALLGVIGILAYTTP